ncbi:MAG: hypothetical protein FJ126_10350 [Deltaproteobacteria bacterium]|nr:hypothetical protein [Deltaproteobacteria bacterium]
MKFFSHLRTPLVPFLLVLLAAPIIPLGCTPLDSLCTKRLYLFRDTEGKGLPPANMALLITAPALVSQVMPEAGAKVVKGLPWAEEKPAHASDAYHLSVEQLDGRLVYQGLCLDTMVTNVCEVRAGQRGVTGKMDLYGPWGHQAARDTLSLNLAPGGVYFLHPDWQLMTPDKNFRLQADLLPLKYDAALRAKLMDWLKRNTKGRSLE